MIVTKCHVTYEFQSTHPVRGATACRYPLAYLVAISIHAPREGCDWINLISDAKSRIFQSTHPVRGATRQSASTLTTQQHFNPRTP